jgi:membrane-bound lytic murein transglycosylase
VIYMGRERVKVGDPKPGDLPPPGTGKAWHDWGAYAEMMVKDPEQWYQLTTDDMHSLAVSIKKGTNSAIRPAHGFEIRTRRTRTDEDGRRRCDLWGRYNPALDTRISRSNETKEQA